MSEEYSQRAWSPDGSRLAFCSSADSRYYVVKTDGTGWVAIDTMFGERQMPIGGFTWSDDGSRIVFSAGPTTRNDYDLFSASALQNGPSVKISGTTSRSASIVQQVPPQ